MWTKSSSNEKPLEVQKVAHDRYLLHRNIKEVTKNDIEGKEYTVYEYEEMLVSPVEKEIMSETNINGRHIDDVETATIELGECINSNATSVSDLETAIIELAEIINKG